MICYIRRLSLMTFQDAEDKKRLVTGFILTACKGRISQEWFRNTPSVVQVTANPFFERSS
jgi:hypothetical protein